MNTFINKGIKNTSFLLLGKIIGIGITYATLIFVVRKVTVEEYGLLSTVRAFVGSFFIFTFGGISSAVMREGAKDIHKMGSLYEETNGFKLLMSIFAILICWITLWFIPYDPKLKSLILIFSFSIMATSLYNHWKEAFTASENFKILTLLKVSQPAFFFILAINLVNYNNRIDYLIYTQLSLQILFMVFCLLIAKKIVRFRLKLFSIRFDKKLITTGAYFFVISFAGMLFMKIDVLMVSVLGSLKEVGIYSVADKIAREGSELRTLIIAGFFPAVIKRIKSGPISKVKVRNTVFKILILSLSAVFILSISIEKIITGIFGPQYMDSALILKYLIFYLAIEYSIYPYILLLLSSNGEKYIAIIYAVLAFANIIINYTFYQLFGLIGIAYSTISVFSLLAFFTLTVGRKILIKERILV